MRIQQIGPLIFDSNTNIIVDATNQDAPGVGFRANDLYNPQPFSVDIAIKRATRQQALDAVSLLAREMHSFAQRRQPNRLAVAGGLFVALEDAAGNPTARSFLRDGSVTLLGVEATTTGVIARVRVAGTLIYPFLNYTFSTHSFSSLLPYERRVTALSGLDDAYLYKHDFFYTVSNMTGLYNALFVVEELETATGASRITAINPASATGGITLQTWNAGWQMLTRALFSTATSGTITYTITTAFPHDVYRLFIEIFCPTTPPGNARYLVSWDGQPQIAETIVGDRSWYTPALFVRSDVTFPLTLEIQNVPTGTLVMPLILIPTDGAFVWNVITPPPLQTFHVLHRQNALDRPFKTVPTGTVYGAPDCITSRYIALFNGVMSPTLTGASANLTIRAYRIEPAAFA